MPERPEAYYENQEHGITIYCGDCLEVMPALDLTLDAVVTSPPYAMQRKDFYNGVAEADYPYWTVRWMDSIKHLLDKDSPVLINIREHIKNGVMSDYVLLTRLALRQAGWTECDELVWVKAAPMPVGDPQRPRRAWERILWFSLTGESRLYPCNNGSVTGRQKWSGDFTSWSSQSPANTETGVARCTDVVVTAPETVQTGHPAIYPLSLATWMVNLSTNEHHTILDPFMGSGTTAIACLRTGRRFVGIEISPEYCDIAVKRIEAELLQPALISAAELEKPQAIQHRLEV